MSLMTGSKLYPRYIKNFAICWDKLRETVRHEIRVSIAGIAVLSLNQQEIGNTSSSETYTQSQARGGPVDTMGLRKSITDKFRN